MTSARRVREGFTEVGTCEARLGGGVFPGRRKEETAYLKAQRWENRDTHEGGLKVNGVSSGP